MAVWELMRDAVREEHAAGQPLLTRGEVVAAALRRNPEVNKGTLAAHVGAMCVNDPSKDHFAGRRYITNPLLVTDNPTMRGKRYRLLTEPERIAFLRDPRGDLHQVSYTSLIEWLGDPTSELEVQSVDEEPLGDEIVDDPFVGGTALLELHLQDYIFRSWRGVFPELTLYNRAAGKEFATSDPSVGILDFLCTDANGNFVVIETKRAMPDRQAVGQILGYMGWVKSKLCTAQQSVRGILVASESSDRLRMAISTVPNLELYLYQISFELRPAES